METLLCQVLICPVRNMLKFHKRKTEFQKSPGQPFFCSIKQSAQTNPAKEPFWYTNCHIGINHIGNLIKQAFGAVGVNVKSEKIMETSCRNFFFTIIQYQAIQHQNLQPKPLPLASDLHLGHRPNTSEILGTQPWGKMPGD